MKALTAQQMREIDRLTTERFGIPSLQLMENAGEGIVLKKVRDSYTTCPKELMDERGGLYDAVRGLNVRVSV